MTDYVPLSDSLGSKLLEDEYNDQNQYPESEFEEAVTIHNLWRGYGPPKKRKPIIKGLQMHVPRGGIYGLLGPSGCGKTTLLKCILGRLDIHGGSLQVLGKQPGTMGHEVPGSFVGFMPQELALSPEMTIHECLLFYAKLHGMPRPMFEHRKRELMALLEMPEETMQIRNLSGGQKRRVSLLAAMIHDPRLLLLDEPTVGVDPLLRSRIWNYLVELAKNDVSIIITTHYIEEARQADVVGMMRYGVLLAEGSPDELLATYGKDTLEETFLELCTSQSHGDLNYSATPSETGDEPPEVDQETINPVAQTLVNSPPRMAKIKALMWKSWVRLRRNVGFLVFQFLLPSVQVVLFCLAIGKNPSGIDITLVQNDHEVLTDPYYADPANNPTLPIGEIFKRKLDKGDAFHLHSAHHMSSAVADVRSGKSFGAIYVRKNFGRALIDRYEHLVNATDTVRDSTIEVRLDMTNQQVAIFIQTQVQRRFEELVGTFKGDISKVPIDTKNPVYGDRDPEFTDFIAPGMIVAIAFAQAVGLTAVGFVMDKKSGIVDRSWAAGLRPAEVLISHSIVQFVLLFVQISLLLFFALVIFALPMKGSVVLVLFMAMLLGFCGMMWGLCIASSVDDEEAANQLAMGTFFPVLLLSGIIWPIQGIPWGLRWISLIIPTTWAAEAMRSIMGRGWGLDKGPVWQGFLMLLAWIFMLFMLSVRGVSNRTK